ncbi:AAA family ATPase [Rhodomicrobium vannielii ATCC 17100]|uniref:AAA family ATPase n=1 Tax=Rhodomicrobium vannielii TaxID=1069 RepID=UPI0019187E84|nr:AAA family ATPase [Rhodomicrobium vannielii]MBJ7533168.1 AAA family ATPase [Rhodomicrobium vannielii ATCC 17100]
MGAVDEILDWSATKLTPWRQDALRRLAGSAAVTVQDESELLDLIKEKAGFSLAAKPPTPTPLSKAHLASVSSGSPLQIKGIRNVKNVNRLVPAAALPFTPNGMTIVYGRNGSGKSGFVRIFRTACRTRTDNPAKLKVLADVYGSSGGPQEAEIIVDLGSGDVVVPWTAGAPASEILLQVAVFDSSAAQLYVDGGNQIQFLPFGLALPHKLNELCLTLRDKLEAERKPITEQIALVTVVFETPRTTKAQTFYAGLTGKVTDAQIDAAATFSPNDEKRVDELTRLLAANTASAADVTALSTWVKNLASECASLGQAFSDPQLDGYRTLKQQAIDARAAAGTKAVDLFSSEPLPGVGGETWRRLWLAAREYSVTDAYAGREFPVLSTPDATETCVLCQQPLSAEASDRIGRFQAFVSGSLAATADQAETAVTQAITSLPQVEIFASKDWATRLEQIRKRNAELADTVTSFKKDVEARRAIALASLQTSEVPPPPLAAAAPVSPHGALQDLSAVLATEAEALAKADQTGERAKLETERAELADRKILTAGRDRAIKRRDLLKEDALYTTALAEVQTKGITQKANELVDTHLTKIVTDHFEVERKILEITHLKVGLARKSGQTKAAFQTNPGTTLTKLTSEILSEGEQRALAAFLTEIAVTEGAGPIVIDDPVSSLDRDCGLKVAARIAAEAQKRQVIIFTHDLIFFNDLCREADDLGVTTETIALFADGANAGKVDPAGVSWKGLSVTKRLARIRNDFAPLKKLHTSSPADYEFKVKHLYGRLRDCYERLVEEHIFCDVVRRGVDRIETQKLRMVHLSDALAIRFHEGMTKANTHSHDNPASDTVSIPDPAAFESDLAYIEQLITDLKAESVLAEGNRPSMKPKKD